MAASTSGALKAHIESLGLSISAYRDRAPEGTAYPYVTISEGISTVLDRDGDFGDAAVSHTARELVQVDLWQQHRNPATNAITESYTLPDALIDGLHGAVLTAAPKRVYGVRHVNTIRLPDPDTNLVRHTSTVAVHRIV